MTSVLSAATPSRRSPTKSKHRSPSKSASRGGFQPLADQHQQPQGLAPAEARALLEDFEVECASRSRTIRTTLQTRQSTFSRFQSSTLSALPERIHNLNIQDFYTKWNGDEERALRECAKEELKPVMQARELEASARKHLKRPAPASPSQANSLTSPTVKKPRQAAPRSTTRTTTKKPTPLSPTQNNTEDGDWSLMDHNEASRIEDNSRSKHTKTTTGKKKAPPTPSQQQQQQPTRRSSRSRSNSLSNSTILPPPTPSSSSTNSRAPTSSKFQISLPSHAPSYESLLQAQKEEYEKQKLEMKKEWEKSMRQVLEKTEMSREERARLEQKLKADLDRM